MDRGYIRSRRSIVSKKYINELKNSFHSLLKDVIGVIDASEHPRERIREQEEMIYSGKASKCTLMTQIIIDSKGDIIKYETGILGHLNDPAAWQNSESIKWMKSLNTDFGDCYLIGDKGYSNQKYIKAPYKKSEVKKDKLKYENLYFISSNY